MFFLNYLSASLIAVCTDRFLHAFQSAESLDAHGAGSNGSDHMISASPLTVVLTSAAAHSLLGGEQPVAMPSGSKSSPPPPTS